MTDAALPASLADIQADFEQALQASTGKRKMDTSIMD